MRVIDLFAGAGGFSTGFQVAGHVVTHAVEINPGIASIYQDNHIGTDVIVDDIADVNISDPADIIIGGPPCQGFSMAGARIRSSFTDDPRNYLFRHYFRIIQSVRPKIFIMENVKGLMSMQSGIIFQTILSLFTDPANFEGNRYYVNHRVLNTREFGIPQSRERLFIIGVLNQDWNIDCLGDVRERIEQTDPLFFDPVTVQDALGNLPTPTPTGIVANPVSQNYYQRSLSSNEEYLTGHQIMPHSAIVNERISRILPGQNFQDLGENINSVHSGAYGRLEWNGVSPTVTTRFDTPTSGRVIHPEQDRTLTYREAARLQSFPDSFVFNGNKSTICKAIGNAVPPKLAYFLGMFCHYILN